MKSRNNLKYACVLLLCLSACQVLRTWEHPLEHSLSFLETYRWKPIQIQDSLIQNNSAYLEFDFQNKHFHGHAGCNAFSGRITLDTDSIHFSQWTSTEMHCSGPGQAVEDALFKLLQSQSFHYDIAEQTLNLYQKNQLVAIFGLQRKQK